MSPVERGIKCQFVLLGSRWKYQLTLGKQQAVLHCWVLLLGIGFQTELLERQLHIVHRQLKPLSKPNIYNSHLLSRLHSYFHPPSCKLSIQMRLTKLLSPFLSRRSVQQQWLHSMVITIIIVNSSYRHWERFRKHQPAELLSNMAISGVG